MGSDKISKRDSLPEAIESLLRKNSTKPELTDEECAEKLKALERKYLERLDRMRTHIGGILDMEATIENYLNALEDDSTRGTDPRDRGN